MSSARVPQFLIALIDGLLVVVNLVPGDTLEVDVLHQGFLEVLIAPSALIAEVEGVAVHNMGLTPIGAAIAFGYAVAHKRFQSVCSRMYSTDLI